MTKRNGKDHGTALRAKVALEALRSNRHFLSSRIVCKSTKKQIMRLEKLLLDLGAEIFSKENAWFQLYSCVRRHKCIDGRIPYEVCWGRLLKLMVAL